MEHAGACRKSPIGAQRETLSQVNSVGQFLHHFCHTDMNLLEHPLNLHRIGRYGTSIVRFESGDF